ncbi:hypothetical protein [Blastopirellula retiformator]|uniref:Uncharacterized protein n=1 Tax=Blastopirellula retiformator TaxID=2527970 RepID=A0A5C5UTW7_9BACT|nr:hypothetical protein [Blastopirellula retiformator]TWT29508.1 hypothetical protein Enr8_50250 [Blastopirellula retiformator]
MSIKLAKLRCPHCGKSLGIPRKLAGKTSPCPRCGESFTIAQDLSQLVSITPPGEEEPIVAEAGEADEPPMALSVEKSESRFPWLILLIAGVTIATLLVIGVVVWMVSPASPPTTEPQVQIEPTATTPAEEPEPIEEMDEESTSPNGMYDRQPQSVEPSASTKPRP